MRPKDPGEVEGFGRKDQREGSKDSDTGFERPGRTRERVEGDSKDPEGLEGEVKGLGREGRSNLSASSLSSATLLSGDVVNQPSWRFVKLSMWLF